MHRARFLVLAVLGLGLGCSTDTRFTEVSPPNGTFTGGEDVELLGSNFPRSGVVVRFGESSRRRVGADKFCRIRVYLVDAPVAVIADVGADLYAVIDRAADRVGRVVVKNLGRSRFGRRGGTEAAQSSYGFDAQPRAAYTDGQRA